MKLRKLRRRFFLLVLACSALAISTAAAGKLSGIVRDQNGKPVPGATVRLDNHETPPVTKRATTDANGTYQFDDLPAGEYEVSAAMAGYLPVAAETSIPVAQEESAVSLDLALTPLPVVADDANSEKKPPAPKFESAGVRGLVDPGGYSAPASAAAASGLIKGMADIKRTGNGDERARETRLPCDLEPELKKSVDENPSRAEANRRLGEFYLAHGRAAASIPFLRRATQSDPTDYETPKRLAAALLETEQFGRAEQLLERLIAQHDDPELHRFLAKSEEGLGQFSQASLEYQKAAEGNPSEENLFGVGYELILAGSPAHAAEAFQSAAKQYPRSIPLLMGLGTAEFLQGRTSGGVRFFLQATDIDPADPRPYPFLASASGVSSAESERVRASFKRFLERQPENAQAYYFYALRVRNSGSPGANSTSTTTAEDLLKRSIQLDPAFAKAHFELATIYFDRGDFTHAEEEFGNALRLDPGMKDAHYRLAAAYRRTGQTDLADEQIRLFQESHEAAKPDRASPGVEEFVSVIAPEASHSALHASCPGPKP